MRNTVETELGAVSVVFNGRGAVVRVVLGRYLPSELVNPEVIELLDEYFAGKRVDFSRVEVDLKVSPFVRMVLERVRKIPYGAVLTYGDLARELKTSARAVGMALSKNPVPVIIPCHRVVGKGGRLVGFSSGLEWKRYLLEIEGCAG